MVKQIIMTKNPLQLAPFYLNYPDQIIIKLGFKTQNTKAIKLRSKSFVSLNYA